MTDDIKQFSFRLPEDSIYALKKAALERRTSPAELIKKVLGEWWKGQPEGKGGPLFPLEGATTATPVAAKPEPSPSKKAAPTKAAGSVTKSPPQKTTKPATKAKK